jgi:hypothetical protein
MGVSICSTRCQYDILKVLLKKIDQNLPIGCVKHCFFCANKNPILHAISGLFCIHQQTCIWDFLSMHFSLHTLLKDVCKVLGCNYNTKWSVEAITGVGSQG